MTSPLSHTLLLLLVGAVLNSILLGMVAAWFWLVARLVRGESLPRVEPFAPARPATWGPGALLALLILSLGAQAATSAGYRAVVGVDLFKLSARYVEETEDRASAPVDAKPDPAATRRLANDAMHLMTWNATFNALFLVAFPWVFRRVSGARLADLGLVPTRLGAQAKVGVVVALLATPAVYMIHLLALKAFPPRAHPVEQMLAIEFSPLMAGVSLLSAVVLAPLFEETVFRGVLQGWLVRVSREIFGGSTAVESEADHDRGRSAEVPGIVLASALFAAVHYPQWPTPIPLFCLAMTMGLLAWKTRSLAAAIVVHALFNATSTLALIAMQLVPTPPNPPPVPSPTPLPAPGVIVGVGRPGSDRDGGGGMSAEPAPKCLHARVDSAISEDVRDEPTDVVIHLVSGPPRIKMEERRGRRSTSGKPGPAQGGRLRRERRAGAVEAAAADVPGTSLEGDLDDSPARGNKESSISDMSKYNYLIVGGGMAADAAVHGVREVDPNGSIGLLCAEEHPPYARPPLSKKLWTGKPLESVWLETEGEGITLLLGRTARSLDLGNKRVVDDRGTAHDYDKLLLATGGTPRRLPFGGDRIIYYRSVDDYRRLRGLTEKAERFAVIGGGFIGSEIAAALAMNGKQVTMVFPDAGIAARAFPADLCRFVTDYYKEKGVEVLAGSRVDGMDEREGRAVLKVRDAEGGDAREVAADGVVAGIGILPNVELARAAGLKVDDGVLVDASLRTSRPDVFAAGDVANFHNPALDGRMRVEHEDNALTMGRLAGQAMAGKAVNYDHLPSFYSDLFDLGYEAVGEIDSRLETFADWREPFREGVVYYLRDGRVRGALLWNVWDQVDAARALIAEAGPFRPEQLKGRLPA